MKKILFLFLLLPSFSVFSWEYHGLKSGMTKEEMMQIPGMANKKGTKISFDQTKFFSEGKPPGFYRIFFDYTSEGELWRLDIYFRERECVVRSKRLLDELFVFIWNGQKAEAQSGYNDDLVMAFSIGLFV